MIFSTLLTFFIGHLLGDFYFQSAALAAQKDHSIPRLLQHSLMYLITMVGVTLPVFGSSLILPAFGISVGHLIIDGSKFLLVQKGLLKPVQEAVIYLVDQLLHGLVIIGVTVYLMESSLSITYLPETMRFLSLLNGDITVVLSWVLILLLVVQPCSITIKKVLNHYRPINEAVVEEDGLPNAGALIGVFERIFILLMLSANQFTAIGFVLTAKSIARYNKISESPQFAEYYLLGTLLSTLLIVISYFIIF